MLPATLQTRVFEIDYLNLFAAALSRTRVSSGQVTQTSADSDRTSTSGARRRDDRRRRRAASHRRRAPSSTPSTTRTSGPTCRRTLRAIIGDGEGRQIVVNAQSGVVFARGMPEELRAVGDYLERIHGAAQRQVVLEAKIIEVTLERRLPGRRQLGGRAAAGGRRRDRGGNLSGGGQIDREPPLAPGRRPDSRSVPAIPMTEFAERDASAPRSRSRSTSATSTRSSSCSRRRATRACCRARASRR